VGANLFHTDGQTDMMKLAVTFCSFADATKKAWLTDFTSREMFVLQNQELSVMLLKVLRDTVTAPADE
jgi:hypothetical protein